MSLAGSCFSSESAPGPLYGVFFVKEFASFPSSVFLVRSQSPFLGPDLRIADGDLRKLPLSMVTTATLIAVEIVRKNPDQVGFAVNPRRWVVERFFAWIGRNRRPAKDFEAPSAPHCLPLRRIRHVARASDR
jgi:hypothetical protein